MSEAIGLAPGPAKGAHRCSPLAVCALPLVYALVIQNNETGRVSAKTALNVPGDHFAFMSFGQDQLSVQGFVAGCFFSWVIGGDAARVKCTGGQWLPEDYAWPAAMPFQGYVDPSFALAFTLVDDASIGQWRIP